MKQILLHNWKIKLICLLLAAVVWYLIQHNVDPGDDGRGRPAAAERAKKLPGAILGRTASAAGPAKHRSPRSLPKNWGVHWSAF